MSLGTGICSSFGRKSCIIADQSGSGKTLAYLVPIVQHMRQEELKRLSESSAKSPRIVILVPTAELASQMLNICWSISKNGIPFRSMVATRGFKQKTQLDSLKQELEVLIATPGRIIFLLQEGFVKLDNLKWCCHLLIALFKSSLFCWKKTFGII
ncbi:DEAD-box ATP-dependent RNA helicase 50 [Iris pallida]|uniref:DEAD-box ATP-dependent RNA helicase 50 n=1 Tax=Iris pallida TaxID=29817 RepID=A0AAX6DKR8_IRIPA|nr:DEAD-box ATP-dependent RNA helicase 50 [Iris pallida]